MKLNITTQIDSDVLDNAIDDLSESLNEKEFNKFAIQIIEMLMYRSHRMGGQNDLKKKVEKLLKKSLDE